MIDLARPAVVDRAVEIGTVFEPHLVVADFADDGVDQVEDCRGRAETGVDRQVAKFARQARAAAVGLVLGLDQ